MDLISVSLVGNRMRLQFFLYEDLISNNFRKTAVLKKKRIVN